MSTYMNVFVKTDTGVREFALEFNHILGKRLAHRQMDAGDVYETDMLGTRVAVFCHAGLEDDTGNNMNFTQYRIQIDIGPATSGQAHDTLAQAMSIYLASEISAKLRWSTMVTDGLRKLVRTFDADG